MRTEEANMIDRKARDAMSEAVQAFMDQKTGSDNFDDTISEIASATQDRSVKAMRDALWSFYSDTEDHKVAVRKEGWDLLNRLRLVLESDAEVEWYRAGKRWNVRKTVSAIGLAGFGVVLLSFGVGPLFFLYWVLSSLATYTLCWVEERKNRKAWEPTAHLFPFPSVGSLLWIRRTAPHFEREHYPKTLAKKAKWHAIFNQAKLVLYFPLYILLGPLAMLFLSLPIRQQQMRIKMPDGSPQRGTIGA